MRLGGSGKGSEGDETPIVLGEIGGADEKEVIRLSDELEAPKESADVKQVDKVKAVEGELAYRTEEDLEKILSEADLETGWFGEGDEREAKVTPMGWFFLVGLGLLGVGVWAALQIGTAEPEGESEVVELELFSGEVEGDVVPEMSAGDRMNAQELHEGIEKVVGRYFAATKPEDFRGVIRHEERVMPLVESYYKNHEFTPKEFQVISEFRIVALENKPFLAMAVNFKDGSTRPALIEDGPHGLKVDWETERSYQPVDLEEFIRERPGESVELRTWVSLDRFYAYEFSDELKYHSFRLGFQNFDDYLFGYVERDSELARRMRKAFGGGAGGRHPMILRLRFPEGSRAPKSVIIEDLISSIWAYPNDPSKVE